MKILKEYELNGKQIKIFENDSETGFQIFENGQLIVEDMDVYSAVDVEYIESLVYDYLVNETI